MYALTRPIKATAWELRGAWAQGLRVSLSMEGDVSRVEGFVETVSPTDAFARVSGLHVPLGIVLAVHRPSRLGDSDGVGDWHGPLPASVKRDPRQLEIPGLLDSRS